MASIPHQPWFPLSSNHYSSSSGSGGGNERRRTGVGPSQLITVASALRLGHFLRLRCNHHLHLLLCLHSEEGYHSVNDIWCLKRNSLLQTIADTFSESWASCFSFFGGSGPEKGKVEKHGLGFKTSRENSGRQWTNVILALNILVYVAQVASQGKLIMWGAKVNSLIDKGQLWRLATSSFLHANIGHLMVNCYSLNSIGPTVEQLSGPRRFLAVYLTSTLTSSLMSYRFCQSPAVGASGAIFGLVGSFAVFVLRHRNLSGGGKQDLQEIARVIALNMVIGLLSRGIDNWGHLGGLLGGAAMSWFLGPAWKYEFRLGGGSIYVDKAPFLQLVNRKKS